MDSDKLHINGVCYDTTFEHIPKVIFEQLSELEWPFIPNTAQTGYPNDQTSPNDQSSQTVQTDKRSKRSKRTKLSNQTTQPKRSKRSKRSKRTKGTK